MKHIYTPVLAIFLIIVIIGFSLYKQLKNSTEGLENMNIDPVDSNVIITRKNKKIRRRKKSIKVDKKTSRVYRENFNIGNAFKSLGNKISKGITDKILGPIKRGFAKFLQFFKAIGSYIKCSFAKVKNLPGCMPWYMLQVFGKCLYLPVIFFVWLFKLQKIERDFWNAMESMDKAIFDIFGFHVIHYPQSVINKCYKCSSLVPFPK
jgi:predicted PurR-regulated permease PerM